MDGSNLRSSLQPPTRILHGLSRITVPHSSALPGQHTRLPGLSPAATPAAAAGGVRVRRLPHKRATVGAALVSAAAFLAVGIQSVPASAKPAAPHPGPLRTGGLEAKLTPAQHSALIRSARQKTTTTARTLGLGAKEKLVVRDVVKDNDGTLHTRYERTYDGLPVLGGDLVVHTPPASLAAGA